MFSSAIIESCSCDPISESKSTNNYGMSKIDVIDSELHARGCGVRSRFAGIVLMFIEIYSLIYINGESYETHCDICPMSYHVTPTSGEIAQNLRNFFQNIAFSF